MNVNPVRGYILNLILPAFGVLGLGYFLGRSKLAGVSLVVASLVLVGMVWGAIYQSLMGRPAAEAIVLFGGVYFALWIGTASESASFATPTGGPNRGRAWLARVSLLVAALGFAPAFTFVAFQDELLAGSLVVVLVPVFVAVLPTALGVMLRAGRESFRLTWIASCLAPFFGLQGLGYWFERRWWWAAGTTLLGVLLLMGAALAAESFGSANRMTPRLLFGACVITYLLVWLWGQADLVDQNVLPEPNV